MVPLVSRRDINLPNTLSLLRVALLPLVLWTLWEEWNTACLLLMAAATATDWLDGYFARRLGLVSDAGKVLDPLADKICIDGTVIALSLWRGFPWWATGLVVGRDLLIVAGGLAVIRARRVVPMSNQPGKWAAGSLAVTIVCYAMGWQPLGTLLLGVSMLMVLVSGGWYAWLFFKQQR